MICYAMEYDNSLGTAEQSEEHKKFLKILSEAQALRWIKNLDYGDAYKRYGSYGVIVELHAKMDRIHNIVKNSGRIITKKEAIRDSALDMINYAAMLIMQMEEEEGKK